MRPLFCALTLFCSPLVAPLLAQAAPVPGPAPALAASVATMGPARGQAEPPTDVLVSQFGTEHPVSIGFARNASLREAVRRQVLAQGHFRIDPSPQITGGPAGFYVGGRLTEMKSVEGWMECRASYVIASQPGPTTRMVETAAASVPASAPGGPEGEARDACLSELAARITEGLRHIDG